MADNTQLFRRRATPRFDTSLSGTLVFGTLLAVSYVALMTLVPERHTAGDTVGSWLNMLREKSLDRGPVQFAIILLFWWSIAFLVQKGIAIWQIGTGNFRRLEQIEIPRQITPANAWDVVNAIGFTGNTVFDFRLRRGLQIIADQRDPRAAAAFLTGQSGADEEAAFRSYAFLRFAMWAMPIVGFIGTVVGIGAGVGSFSQSLNSAELGVLRQSLTGVTGGLTVAFDTTLAGLVATTIVTGIYTLMLRREQNILGLVDSLLRREVIARLTTGDSEAEERTRQTAEMTHALISAIERMGGGTGTSPAISEEAITNAIEAAVQRGADAFGRIGAIIEQAGNALASAIVSRFDESAARIQAEHRKLTDRMVEAASESFQRIVDSQGKGMQMHLARMKELSTRSQQLITLQTEAIAHLAQTERAQLSDVQEVHRSLQAVLPLLSGLSKGFRLLPIGVSSADLEGETVHDAEQPANRRGSSGDNVYTPEIRKGVRDLAPQTPVGKPLDLNADFGEQGPSMSTANKGSGASATAFPAPGEDTGARPASDDAWADTLDGVEAQWSDSDGIFSGTSPFAEAEPVADALPADSDSANGDVPTDSKASAAGTHRSAGSGKSGPGGKSGGANGSGPRKAPSTTPDPFAGASPFEDSDIIG
ncbi:MAG: MotA/TolQ/ExbB proton channel family protein [Planctomycetota bacterium]